MVERERLGTRCNECVIALSQRYGWGLSSEQIDTYVEQILLRVPSSSLERQMELVVGYFHADHQRVADLRAPEGPLNADAWAWVEREIARVAHLNGLSWSRDPVVELSDLVQTVNAEVVRSLDDFHYESKLSTWIQGVTVRRLRRFHRDSLAAKRAVRPEPLEAASEQPVEWAQSEQPLLASALVAEIERVLGATGDKRYAWIFLMRVLGDLSSKEIGAQLNLHPSRVRALLKIARDLLRADPRLRGWGEEEQPDDSDVQ